MSGCCLAKSTSANESTSFWYACWYLSGKEPIGDSAITETCGLGAFAMAGSPMITQLVGGTPRSAIEITQRMYEITETESELFRLPNMDFRGTPVGIDIRRVVESGIEPEIDTGISHKVPGIGQIGAGLTVAPIECFAKAVEAFAARTSDPLAPRAA